MIVRFWVKGMKYEQFCFYRVIYFGNPICTFCETKTKSRSSNDKDVGRREGRNDLEQLCHRSNAPIHLDTCTQQSKNLMIGFCIWSRMLLCVCSLTVCSFTPFIDGHPVMYIQTGKLCILAKAFLLSIELVEHMQLRKKRNLEL